MTKEKMVKCKEYIGNLSLHYCNGCPGRLCGCLDCSYERDAIEQDALEVIDELQKENEELKNELATYKDGGNKND